MVESDFLHSPNSALAPTGCGYGVDQHSFGWRLRLMFFEQLLEKFKEIALLFDFQNDGFRQETMAGAVAGRVVLSLGGDWRFGLGSVGTGGLNLFRGAHATSVCTCAARK